VRISASTAQRLEEAFRALPDMTPETVVVEGSIAAVRALQAKEADLAIVMADVAYQAYVTQSDGQPTPSGQIRGVAVLNVNTVYLAAAPHTSINSLADLRGRRVSLGSSGAAATAIATLLLKSSGVGLHRVHVELSPYQDTLKHLSNGKLDAAFLSLNASVHAAAAAGARLVPITGAWIEQLRQQYPFLQSVLVPAGSYPGQTAPLQTVGVDLVLACRADLDHDVVYRLSKAYFEGLQRSAPATDLERAPATPIPLHPGAARYYRERALSR
jgi:TRAP transporter TAXI family solute receptor